MHLFWLLISVICATSIPIVFTASTANVANSGRIPANVKIYSKSDLQENSNLRLVPPSNPESNVVNPSPPEPYRGNPAKRIVISDINLPPSLKGLHPRHKILYQRALEKDYDYAQFGQRCKVFTVDELDAFIGVFEDSIMPHEGESQDRTISPQEKAEQLQQLFNTSKTICDFRNLLTCHKHFLTCSCAHSSMGVNRDGLCGVNIGHPCELSGRKLKKFGVLVTPEMSPIKCLLENAECVMENENDVLGGGASPVRKICKCRSGFWGATCSRRSGPASMKLVESNEQKQRGKLKTRKKEEPSLSEELEGGRPFWMNDIGATAREYFMHPEEIKEKLVDMMNEREMYLPENRAEEAQKLVRKLESDSDKEEMVVNELHLRKLAVLKHGDSCDPKIQLILDNPPVSKDANHRWADPPPEDIKSWQLGLLQQKKPFCNVYKLLRCNDASKVCECKSGLELETSEGGHKQCKIPMGYNCDVDFEPPLEFDPIKDRKRFSEMDPPSCISGTSCVDKPLFFQKKCWCSGNKCEKQFDDEFSSLAIQRRSTLKRGDSCDVKLHQRLLNYRSDEDQGHEKRLMVFREILDNPEVRLCDIENYLNCSDSTRTCDCWNQLLPSQLEDGDFDCVAMNMASCGRTFEYGKYLYDSDGAQLWQVEKAFQKKFRPGCVPGAKCAGGNNPEWAGRCVCEDASKTGETCGDTKSILATAFRARSIPQDDIEEMDLLRVYFDLNKQTVLMEQLMTSGLNDVCDPNIGLTLDRIIKFWKEIANSNDVNIEKRTLPYYIAATKYSKFLVSTVQGNSASLCNATLGLRCHRSTGRCGCHRGARWIGERCYLDPDEQCNPQPDADWVTTCMEGTKCLSTDQKDSTEYRCASCDENDECEDDEVEPEEDEEEMGDTWNEEKDEEGKGGDENENSLDEEHDKLEKIIKEESLDDETEKSVSKRSVVVLNAQGDDDYDEDDKVEHYFVAKGRSFGGGNGGNGNGGGNGGNGNGGEGGGNGGESGGNGGDGGEGGEGGEGGGGDGFGSGNEHKTTTRHPKRTTRHTSTKRPTKHPPTKEGTKMPKPPSPSEAHLSSEINRMLRAIMMRTIPLGETCLIDDEESLTKVHETLSLNELEKLPTSLEMVFVIVNRLYWKGISFCNRNQFLKCTWDAVCGCSLGMGLVEDQGECKLKEHYYCSNEKLSAKRRSIAGRVPAVKAKRSKLPPFLCRRGTSCIDNDFGMSVCARDDSIERENNETIRNLEQEQSGSNWTWTRVHIYSVGLAVAIRLIITWAIV